MASDAPDVVHEVTDRGVEDLSKAALVAEWEQACEATRVFSSDDPEERDRLWDRRTELWFEMRSRVDEQPPACPECGGREWHQTMSDPKRCGDRGLELGALHEDLIEEIDAFWAKVRAVPEEVSGDGE